MGFADLQRLLLHGGGKTWLKVAQDLFDFRRTMRCDEPVDGFPTGIVIVVVHYAGIFHISGVKGEDALIPVGGAFGLISLLLLHRRLFRRSWLVSLVLLHLLG